MGDESTRIPMRSTCAFPRAVLLLWTQDENLQQICRRRHIDRRLDVIDLSRYHMKYSVDP